MKSIALCGLGNALVDVLVKADETVFANLGLERGSMRLVDPPTQGAILSAIPTTSRSKVSGGSVANSVVAFAQLGGTAAFLGCVADDEHGAFYKEEMESFGIRFPAAPMKGGVTGCAVCVITPDAERTMVTSLGVSSSLAPEHIDEAVIRDSEWLFIEGYVFANPAHGQPAIKRAIALAKQHGTKIAITLSESWVVDTFRAPVEEAMACADLVFANEREVCGLFRVDEPLAALEKLEKVSHRFVMTMGPRGAYVYDKGTLVHAPACPTTPVDLTGAGDMFAGTFLYGLVRGMPPKEAARRACYMSAKVISLVGARIPEGVPSFFEEAV